MERGQINLKPKLDLLDIHTFFCNYLNQKCFQNVVSFGVLFAFLEININEKLQ